MEIRNVVLADGSVVDIVFALLKGITVGFMLDGMCKTPLGVILKPMMAIFGLADQTDQIVEAIKSGDPVEITVRFVQLICMLFGISSQCFTGETLVSTENGLFQISEINVGDYVWTENVETGEKELKQVLQVYVNETDTLVHLSITDENGSKTTINTTENHPFYTEGKGWIVASQLENGDKLRTKDGKIQVVKEVSVETLDEPVKVYNLEVDEQHTYYVSDSEVLVHNECKTERHHIASDKSIKSGYTAKYQELFDMGGMSLQDPDNIIELENHSDAHTKIYKEKVLRYLESALEGGEYNTEEENEKIIRAVLAELRKMLRENPRLPYKGGWED